MTLIGFWAVAVESRYITGTPGLTSRDKIGKSALIFSKSRISAGFSDSMVFTSIAVGTVSFSFGTNEHCLSFLGTTKRDLVPSSHPLNRHFPRIGPRSFLDRPAQLCLQANLEYDFHPYPRGRSKPRLCPQPGRLLFDLEHL